MGRDSAIKSQDINYLLNRGVAEIIVEEEMIKLLRSGRKFNPINTTYFITNSIPALSLVIKCQ